MGPKKTLLYETIVSQTPPACCGSNSAIIILE